MISSQKFTKDKIINSARIVPEESPKSHSEKVALTMNPPQQPLVDKTDDETDTDLIQNASPER